jgi:hypothetical protein
MSGIQTGSVVEDIPYDPITWDGNQKAPSKNSIRDLLESLTTSEEVTFIDTLVLEPNAVFQVDGSASFKIFERAAGLVTTFIDTVILDAGSVFQLTSTANVRIT